MAEIEVKAKIKNFEELRRRLLDLGCELSEAVEQNDQVFVHKNIYEQVQKRGFEAIVRGMVVLRIRESLGRVIFTMKKQLANQLACDEKEVEVSNAETMKYILENSEFRLLVKINKKRQKCRYKDMEICLDNVEGLGNFVEVERMTDEEDVVGVQEELFEFLEGLGISRDDRVEVGYDEMIWETKKASH